MDKGWIKIHRKFLDWEWFSDGNMVRVFLHFLLTANYEAKKWKGIDIERGQLVTGRDELSRELKLSPQTIRTILARLKRTGEITIKATNRNSIITICNYETYQQSEAPIQPTTNQPSTNQQPTDNQPSTTTKEVKKERSKEVVEVKEKSKRFIPPTLDEVSKYCLERNNSVDANRFIDFYGSKGWMVGKNKMKCWKSAVRNWERSSKQINSPTPQAQNVNDYWNNENR